MNLLDKQLNETQRVCIFGPPKVGKTELVGKLAEHYKLIFIDLENGFSTLKKLSPELQKNIELISIPDTRVFPIAIETCLKIIDGLEHFICEHHGKVKCALCEKDKKPTTRVCFSELGPDSIVVWDSGTQLANSAMNNITKNMGDTPSIGWDEYKKQGFLMDKFLTQLQQARYHTAFITHETEVELEDGSKKIVPVSGSTNYSRNTAKYFDHIIYCQIRNKKHNFASSTLYSMNVLTGSRTDVKIEDMEVASLLPIFRGEVAKKSGEKIIDLSVKPAGNPLQDRLAKLKLGG